MCTYRRALDIGIGLGRVLVWYWWSFEWLLFTMQNCSFVTWCGLEAIDMCLQRPSLDSLFETLLQKSRGKKPHSWLLKSFFCVPATACVSDEWLYHQEQKKHSRGVLLLSIFLALNWIEFSITLNWFLPSINPLPPLHVFVLLPPPPTFVPPPPPPPPPRPNPPHPPTPPAPHPPTALPAIRHITLRCCPLWSGNSMRGDQCILGLLEIMFVDFTSGLLQTLVIFAPAWRSGQGWRYTALHFTSTQTTITLCRRDVIIHH